MTINIGLMEKVIGALDKASRRVRHEIHVTADSLLRIPQIMELRRKEFNAAEAAFLESCFRRTLDDVLSARAAEGKKTAAQIREFLKQARQALTSGDVDGAHTLAVKAKASDGARLPVLPPVGRAGRVIPLARRRP